MSRRTMRMAVLALVCVLAGRLAVAEAQPGKKCCAATDLRCVTYPVADLIIPIPNGDLPIPGCQIPGMTALTLEDRLMDLIRSTVAPRSWRDNGGPATIQYYPMKMALVIQQTPEAHGDIVDLLKALRRLQEVEVAVELRIVTMSEAMAEEFQAKGGFETCKVDGGKAVPTAFLADKELYPWLRLFQSDGAGQIMMAPKVTVFSSQRAHVDVTQQHSFVTEYRIVRDKGEVAVVPNQEKVAIGMHCEVLPTISADRRFVNMKVDFRDTQFAGPPQVTPVRLTVARDGEPAKEFRGVVQQPQLRTLALKHACTIADGRTMVVPLGSVMSTQCEVTEVSVPVLSKIPYVNRLVRNVGYTREARAVFLMVTPRIIVVNEEEEMGVELGLQGPAMGQRSATPPPAVNSR
jgi:type II secretory pathway component GspD/PulD (secretin)